MRTEKTYVCADLQVDLNRSYLHMHTGPVHMAIISSVFLFGPRCFNSNHTDTPEICMSKYTEYNGSHL